MKSILVLAALALSPVGEIKTETKTDTQDQLALLCFSTGQEIDGLNKICYYDCAGSRAAITVSSIDLCPITIER